MGQVSDVQIANFKRQLARLIDVEEVGRRRECPIDHWLRDAVIGNDQKTCIVARMGNCVGQSLTPVWFPSQEIPDIQHWYPLGIHARSAYAARR